MQNQILLRGGGRKGWWGGAKKDQIHPGCVKGERQHGAEKTLFNGCLSRPAAALPVATMKRDLVQNNWSQSRLLPGLPLVDL